MPNKDNLIPFSERTESEARELGKKGGRASGKARRRKRAMRDVAKVVFSSHPKLDEDQIMILKQFGIDPEAEDITCAFLSIVALVQKAMNGDLRAIELYLKIVGEDVFSVNAKAKLDFEKEQIKALDVDDEERIAGFNAQILSLADLIKNPLPRRELPS